MTTSTHPADESKDGARIDTLPPLPEPAYRAGDTGMLGEHCYTADQLRAYAAAAVAAERERCVRLATPEPSDPWEAYSVRNVKAAMRRLAADIQEGKVPR